MPRVSDLGRAAPGDGQTGMVTYPLWGLGALLGTAAIVAAIVLRSNWRYWLAVAIFAAMAIASVVWAFGEAMRYEARHSLAVPPTRAGAAVRTILVPNRTARIDTHLFSRDRQGTRTLSLPTSVRIRRRLASL